MPDRQQTIYAGQGAFSNIGEIIKNAKKPFIVCEKFLKEKIKREKFDKSAVYFCDFTPNPDVEQISTGAGLFEKEDCDFIISIGGGSAIDTAKGINMTESGKRANHLAIPTTAGTGSESTCFAVLYRDGEKISLEHQEILPQYVILDSSFLKTLPPYHKKSALLDALCQSVESLWARGRTAISQAYALSAMRIINENARAYLNNCENAALRILYASNLSGKAINISKTTAAHAMSYKLSTEFKLAHGHAVALCLPHVWKHLSENNAVPDTLTANDYENFTKLLSEIDMGEINNEEIYAQAEKMAASVNTQRLSNHPVELSNEVLTDLYRRTFYTP